MTVRPSIGLPTLCIVALIVGVKG